MKIKLSSVPVRDQDKALRFYTEVLGFVKKHDIPVGGPRWLTVVSPQDPGGTELVLEPNADYPDHVLRGSGRFPVYRRFAMAISKAKSVLEYLAELPPERRAVIASVRNVILKNLDSAYEEGMQYGMIGYYVPHRLYPAGYRPNPKQPLPFVGLASQKQYISLYMAGPYCGCGEPGSGETSDSKWFREAWLSTGKKLDMGKACVRFKRLEDVPLDVIGEAVARIPVRLCIARYESALGLTASTR